MCVTVAVSSKGSPSSAAVTLTVCAVAQLVVENVRLSGLVETSVLSVGSLMVTVTSSDGCVFSATVYVPVLPSLTVRSVVEIATLGGCATVISVSPTIAKGPILGIKVRL